MATEAMFADESARFGFSDRVEQEAAFDEACSKVGDGAARARPPTCSSAPWSSSGHFTPRVCANAFVPPVLLFTQFSHVLAHPFASCSHDLSKCLRGAFTCSHDSAFFFDRSSHVFARLSHVFAQYSHVFSRFTHVFARPKHVIIPRSPADLALGHASTNVDSNCHVTPTFARTPMVHRSLLEQPWCSTRTLCDCVLV
jgi:hypothetical protein